MKPCRIQASNSQKSLSSSKEGPKFPYKIESTSTDIKYNLHSLMPAREVNFKVKSALTGKKMCYGCLR